MEGWIIIYSFIDCSIRPITLNEDATLRMYKVSFKRNNNSSIPPKHLHFFFHFDKENCFCFSILLVSSEKL